MRKRKIVFEIQVEKDSTMSEDEKIKRIAQLFVLLSKWKKELV